MTAWLRSGNLAFLSLVAMSRLLGAPAVGLSCWPFAAIVMRHGLRNSVAKQVAGICIQRVGPAMGARASIAPLDGIRATKAPRGGGNCFPIRGTDSTHRKRSRHKDRGSAFWEQCGCGGALDGWKARFGSGANKNA